MDTEDNGLTLEGLAQRLEALECENERMRSDNERMRSENAELRGEVAALSGSGTRLSEVAQKERGSNTRRSGHRGEGALALDGQVSRRSLLTKAGAAAVAAVAAGTMLGPRQAKAHDATTEIAADRVLAHYIEAKKHVGGTALLAQTTSTSTFDYAVLAFNQGPGPGIGSVNTGAGPAIYAEAQGEGGTGVVGTLSSVGSNTGNGVVGRGRGASFAGVLGINEGGYGVKGEGLTGVWGLSSHAGFAASYGQNTNAGWGVVGDGKGSAYSGVMGRSDSGSGVKGESQSGYGGQFEGGKAQLKLKPAGSAGKPTTGTHLKGEIYMDSAGTLFVCVRDGTPGRWKKLSATAV